MQVTGTTGICCIIGFPVKHSLSPLMHNAAFKACRVNLSYVAFEVSPFQLERAISGIRALGIAGFNVTIPHKEPIIRYLDELGPLASEMGAVNTVTRQDEILIGTNTDGNGAVKALKHHGIEINGRKIVILGAGGAARAISYVFSDHHCESIVFLNRTKKRAELLSKELENKGIRTKCIPLTKSGLKQSLKPADMLVNTTSIGMYPRVEESLIPSNLLPPDLVVFDIVYNPPDTKLLRDAKKRGLRTIDGVDMLVYQGATAFESWTGKNAPIETMRQAIIQKLRGD